MFRRENMKLTLLRVFVVKAVMILMAAGPLLPLGDISASEAGVGQASSPAIEYQSLLKLQYYEADGGFLVDHLQMIFPPGGNPRLTFVITDRGGQEIARVPLRVERLQTFEAFRLLQPNGVPGVVSIGQSGDFLMGVKVGDQTVTTLPFTLKEEKSNDPFNPKKRYVREGPWRELAYFSSPLDKPDTPMKFNWWISLRELPAGLTRPLCTIHLMQGGQEIATTRSPVVPTNFDWQFFKTELVQSKGPGSVQWLTLASLTRKDGELSIVIKANGRPVKSYRAQVRNGQLQRLARNQLEVEPHTDFIAPRLIDTSRDGGCEYCMLDTFWVRANQQ